MKPEHVLKQLIFVKSQMADYKKDGELHGFIDDQQQELEMALSNAIMLISQMKATQGVKKVSA